jgi:hypothetical protein
VKGEWKINKMKNEARKSFNELKRMDLDMDKIFTLGVQEVQEADSGVKFAAIFIQVVQ